MNKVILMGRLTRDPDMRYTQGDNSMAVARFTLAVDRRRTNADGQRDADFIGCVSFGRQAEFAGRYLHQGTKIVLTGRIQTGSYTNKDGQKVYTTDVIGEDLEFAESKAASEGRQSGSGYNRGNSYGNTRDDNRGGSYNSNRNDNRTGYGNSYGNQRDDGRTAAYGSQRDDNRADQYNNYRDDNRGSSYSSNNSDGDNRMGQITSPYDRPSEDNNRNPFNSASDNSRDEDYSSSVGEGFMNIPEGIEDEGLPFN